MTMSAVASVKDNHRDTKVTKITERIFRGSPLPPGGVGGTPAKGFSVSLGALRVSVVF